MKLLYCPKCHHIQNLQVEYKLTCKCQQSYGYYHADGLNATVGGEGIILGIANPSFLCALTEYEQYPKGRFGKGIQFEAFFIPKDARTVQRDNNDTTNNN